MNITTYEKNKGFVLENLRKGEFDYVDSGCAVFEEDFFRYGCFYQATFPCDFMARIHIISFRMS